MDLNILGIGPAEILFFVVILLLLFGPKDLARMARDLGRFIARVTRSENFQTIQKASQEIRSLPQRIVQEAHLEDIQQEAQALRESVAGPLTPPPPKTLPPVAQPSPTNSPFPAWTQELPPEVAPPAPAGESVPRSDAGAKSS